MKLDPNKNKDDLKIIEYINFILKQDIFNEKAIHDTNIKLNKLLYKKIKAHNNENICTRIYQVSDEISVLSETAIKKDVFEQMLLSKHFIQKQDELKNLLKDLYK